MPEFDVATEYDHLTDVVMGRGHGYHRSPDLVEIANSTHQKTFDAVGHPTEAQLIREFAGFKAAMERYGVAVHEPALAPDSVQDQTCPRDIGFVIGDTFVTAGMRHAGRVDEIEGIAQLLQAWGGPHLRVPQGMSLEGGDVILHERCVFVGAGQRSDLEGLAFLAKAFPDHRIIAVPTRSLSEGEEVLHLDCAFNPLGLGHALIYPQGLAEIPDEMKDGFDWIEVTKEEATALATNVFSIAPDVIIARSHPSCARVNAALRAAGYTVEEVAFDGVPSTGGSFRCATLPLRRVRS